MPQTMDMIHPDVALVALDGAPGTQFEKFAQEFFAAYTGETFIPLGGTRDGGADAFQGDGLWMTAGTHRYWQASVEQDPKAKISATVKRLREFGRHPRRVTYVTSRIVPHTDRVEDTLTDELDVSVRIRDARWFANNINSAPQTVAAYRHHIEPLAAHLRRVGGSQLLIPSQHVASPAVYVFLRQELERREGMGSFLDAVTDSLAIWALEGTDPDAGKLMSRDEVLAHICDELPFAKALIDKRLGKRLETMSKKSYPGGRAIQWHRKDDQFCLPYETRAVVEQDNLSDEVLRIEVLASLKGRVAAADAFLSEDDAATGSAIVMRALQLAYEAEGLEFANFLELRGVADEFPTIADHLRSAIDEVARKSSKRAQLMVACFEAIRSVLYNSNQEERRYLAKLSRTYALLMTLRTDPNLVQYFQQMAADFYLYVGSDQLIRAISERYLPAEDRATRVMLRMAAESGSSLILTEPVLNEVISHLKACNQEYQNYIEPLGGHLTSDIARNVPRILLRAFCYAKLDPARHPGAPQDWPSYVGHLVDYGDLYRPRGVQAIRRYLLSEFKMKYVSDHELQPLVRKDELSTLSEQLLDAKAGNATLAHNDALLALAVYGHRRSLGEESEANVFGAHTWWLTDESRILAYTGELVRHHGDTPYMMRPDFLLNFIALSPNTAQVRATYANVFPSLLGIRMAKRMDEKAFHDLMDTVKGFANWDGGRKVAEIQSLSDRLKGDFQKRYAISIRV